MTFVVERSERARENCRFEGLQVVSARIVREQVSRKALFKRRGRWPRKRRDRVVDSQEME